MPLHVASIWRYPVKSLAGEPLAEAAIEPDGIRGDRVVRVRGPEGVRTSRRHPAARLHATLGPDGRARIDGHDWQSAEASRSSNARPAPTPGSRRGKGSISFDILPLLVATDGAVAAFGRDVRRLRPNIVIGGVDGLGEREWPGAELHIGEAIIRLRPLRGRCNMTTVDPDTLAVDPGVLRDIVRRFGGKLALNAEVLRRGIVRVGDPVALFDRTMAS